MSAPDLTHTDFLAASDFVGRQTPGVQVRPGGRYGAVVFCGRVVELLVRDVELGRDFEFFVVETLVGRFTVSGRRLRLCAEAGGCSCDSGGQPC